MAGNSTAGRKKSQKQKEFRIQQSEFGKDFAWQPFLRATRIRIPNPGLNHASDGIEGRTALTLGVGIAIGIGVGFEFVIAGSSTLKPDSDSDSDPDPEELSCLVAESGNGTPERQSFSGSHGQRLPEAVGLGN